MHRLSLAVLVGAAVVVLPATAAASKHHKKPAKPSTFKTGTYSAKTTGSPQQRFSITLKKSTCAAAPGQGTSPLHLCVSVTGSPVVGCTTPLLEEYPIPSFATPVALPASGRLTEHAAAMDAPPEPGGEPETGEATFSVTFTKTGTASGAVAQNLTYTLGQEHGLKCDSGSVSFTAKVA
jgi:hypothetical protein